MMLGRPECFHGHRAQDHSNAHVIAHIPGAAWRGPLPPFGGPFDWGRPGRGSEALALSLLVATLGPAALCPACDGRQRILWNGPDALDDPEPWHPVRHADADHDRITDCPCDRGLRTLPAAAFGREVIAALPDRWRLTRREVLAWLVGQYETVPSWLAGELSIQDLELPT